MIPQPVPHSDEKSDKQVPAANSNKLVPQTKNFVKIPPENDKINLARKKKEAEIASMPN